MTEIQNSKHYNRKKAKRMEKDIFINTGKFKIV